MIAGNAALIVPRFASYLNKALQSDNSDILTRASKALGRLVPQSEYLAKDLVKSEIRSALEWLESEKHVNKRLLAAFLIIKELAANAPALMFTHAIEIFGFVWVGIRDSDPLVRQTAAEATGECLNLTMTRDKSLGRQWYMRFQEDISLGFQSSDSQWTLGSLLLFKELAVHRGLLTIDRYKLTCHLVLRLIAHRSPRVQEQLITILPALAIQYPAVFAQTFLEPSMSFLRTQLTKGKNLDAVFHTIGEMVAALGTGMTPYLSDITTLLREGLLTTGKHASHTNDASILNCIRTSSLALGPAFSASAQSLLESMLTSPLTQELRGSLEAIAEQIPSLKFDIQKRFLLLLEELLLPRRRSSFEEKPAIKDHHLTASVPDDRIVFGLRVLAEFDFGCHSIHDIVCKALFVYEDHDNSQVRKAAALTCCQYFLSDLLLNHRRIPCMPSDVHDKLLSLAIGDPSPKIREAVLSAFPREFDITLAQPQHVRTMILAINDEVFGVRIAAMGILARLSSVNPAYVLPSLRKELLNLLTGLAATKPVAQKLEAIQMIRAFASNSSPLLEAFVAPILDVLLPRANDESQTIVTATLNAIAELMKVAGPSLRPYGPRLMPLFLRSLTSLTSNMRREAALEAISQLVQNTGCATPPYIEYPELLPALTKLVKVEEVESIRMSTVRLLGTLGALDPVKCLGPNESTFEIHCVNMAPKEQKDAISMRWPDVPDAELYLISVFQTILNDILAQPSLKKFHPSAINAMVMVCKVTGIACISFLDKMISAFQSVIQASSGDTLSFYFSQLGALVDVIGTHIRPYLPGLLETVRGYWGKMNQAPLISFIESLSLSMGNEMKRYFSMLLPMVVTTLEQGTSSAAKRVLHLLVALGSTIEEYMHCIIPSLLRVVSNSSYPKKLRGFAIDCIASLSDEVDFSELASPVIQSLMTILGSNERVLVQASMNCFCSLMHLLGPDFLFYTRTLDKVLARHHIIHERYSLLVSKLRNGDCLPSHFDAKSVFDPEDQCEHPQIRQRDLNVNLERLKNAWDTSLITTTREWQQWFQELILQVLEESPCAALRACASLAELYSPFGKRLFHMAFSSCWTALPPESQETLAQSIDNALASPTTPYEIVSNFLSLAEFMDRTNKSLPIDSRTMSHHAMASHAYAKALRYEELHFNNDPNMRTLETLMAINSNLQQSDSAHGILRTSHELANSGTQETWLEKLHYWKAALASYEKRERNRPNAEDEDWGITLGKIRCLHALQDWKGLSEVAAEKWGLASPEHQRTIAPLAATAAWRLKNWELMQSLFQGIKPGTADRSFFGAVLAVHADEFDVAATHITDAQRRLDPELTIMLDESYGRSYEVIVRLHMLAELEEIILYKKSRDPEKRRQIHEMWNQRLLGCQRSMEDWQRILNLRTLSGCSVLEDIGIWIKFANMCRKENCLALAEDTIRSVEEAAASLPGPTRPEITLAHLKISWDLGSRREALNGLKALTRELEEQLFYMKDPSRPINEGNRASDPADPRKIISKCYRSLADWQTALHRGVWNAKHIDAILSAYDASMRYNRDSYKACHVWAMAAYKTARLTAREASPNLKISENTLRGFVITAIRALYQSISMAPASPLQDILKILTLWFTQGAEKEVNRAVKEGFSVIPLEAWLGVSPQLVARITSPSKLVRTSVQKLLAQVARSHPQALVYPLTVAMKSRVAQRSESACDIIENMRQHSPNLVLQADIVSHELIRVSALWHELWHETLEEASRTGYARNDVSQIYRLLLPLHTTVEAGPETLSEVGFCQSFGPRLATAKQLLLGYAASGDPIDLDRAWNEYKNVYQRLHRQLLLTVEFDLTAISPKLKSCANLDIAVPGTYRNQSSTLVKVAHFNPSLHVFQSRKRPRKMKIVGDDGNVYLYILKGQEDIRQDERVMQLFGLVNTLFAGDSASVQRQLGVQAFPAIPLSQSAGLLGWVSNSDTFQSLVRGHRESRAIPPNLEYTLMLRMSPSFENLPLIQKVEVFQEALNMTPGKDLYQVLWLRNTSSEAWLTHRTHYTRSLAVMSIVGYILGLGDRHPANLLLHRNSGNIVHVDFGDCFDVARLRDHYPERVPFRLTRMLVVAMGIGNLEGNFRAACEIVMRVLRTHKDSIMTILEAVCISFRLDIR